MRNLFLVKGEPVRNFLIVFLFSVSVICIMIASNYDRAQHLWQQITGKTETPPQQTVSVAKLVPPQPATPPQEVARVANPCCCPCSPQKTKTTVHAKKKKIQRPRSAPTIAQVIPTASQPKGCVEIHVPTRKEQGDAAVAVPIFSSKSRDEAIALLSDHCVGIKRAGDTTFTSLKDEVCPTIQPALCDFSEFEKVIGGKRVLMGSFFIKTQGEQVIRLPASFAEENAKERAAIWLIRGTLVYPDEKPGTTIGYRVAEKYGADRITWMKRSPDMMGIRWFDYDRNGIATIYYSKSEVPKNAAQLYIPEHEWRGP